jgi:tetratricopeptide (TPR) repeat protein
VTKQMRLLQDQRDFIRTKATCDARHPLDDTASLSSVESADSLRSLALFGNIDGIPVRLSTQLAAQDDHHDLILLGPLHPALTCEERVRETVWKWFGKNQFQPTSSDNNFKNKQSIPVDLDEQFVPNAELRLQQIYTQAMHHLDYHQYGDAIDLFQSALNSHRAKYGNTHHLVGTALHNMGRIHLLAGKDHYTQAFDVFSQAVQVRQAALGVEHPDVHASLLQIGLVHMACGQLRRAQQVFWDLRERFLKVVGYGHPFMAKLVNNLGVCAYELGDFKTALQQFELAYEYTQTRGVDVLCNRAFCQFQKGNVLESLQLYELALEQCIDDPIRAGAVEANIHHLVGDAAQCRDFSVPETVGCSGPAGMCLFLDLFDLER